MSNGRYLEHNSYPLPPSPVVYKCELVRRWSQSLRWKSVLYRCTVLSTSYCSSFSLPRISPAHYTSMTFDHWIPRGCVWLCHVIQSIVSRDCSLFRTVLCTPPCWKKKVDFYYAHTPILPYLAFLLLFLLSSSSSRVNFSVRSRELAC